MSIVLHGFLDEDGGSALILRGFALGLKDVGWIRAVVRSAPSMSMTGRSGDEFKVVFVSGQGIFIEQK
jgi:hypothetical protein